MFSPEIEFSTLVSEYRRLVEKYAGRATDVRTVPTSSGVAETLLVDDLQTIQLASPFNVPWATSPHLDSLQGLTDQATNKLVLGASLETALSRVINGLKDESSSPVQARSNQSWFLQLASLEYAKSLARFSVNSGPERTLASGTTFSSVEDFARALQSKLDALHSENDRHKRKDGGNYNENVLTRRSLPVKKPRLVWTADLHKRFEEAVHKLGNSKAVPKAILEEMNIDGLTRENIASHLQKYRQHQERQKGVCENRRNHGNLNKDASKELSPSADSPAATCDS